MTVKQRLFVNEYLIDLNATRAYRAIYKKCKSEDVAAVNGNRLLRNAKVAEYIEQRMKDREKRVEIKQDRVIMELAAIAFSNGADFAQVVEEPLIADGKYVMDPDTGTLRTAEAVRIIPTDQLPEEKRKAIAGIKEGRYGIEISTYDKVKALELLGKHLGMFKERIELSTLEEEKSKLDDVIMQLRE